MSSNIRIKRFCEQCGEEFTAKTTVTRYCGDRCAKRAYKARKRAEKIEQSNKETKQVIERPLVELQAKEFLTIQETCQLIGVSRTTLWRTIKKGKLKAGKLGNRTVIRKTDLQNLFN